jgi:hypothetical protein
MIGTYSSLLVDPEKMFGGACTLVLSHEHFELRLHWQGPYGIYEGDTFRGTFVATRTELTLETRERYRFTEETTRQDSTERCSRRFVGRLVPGEPAAIDLELDSGKFEHEMLPGPVRLHKDQGA